MKLSRLEKAFVALAGIGALGFANVTSSTATDDTLQSVIAKDSAVNTDANGNFSDCSGIVGLTADSSGIAGWYTQPIALPVQAVGAQAVYEAKIAGDVLAVLTDTQLSIYKVGAKGTIPQLEESIIVAPGATKLAVSPLSQEIAISGSALRFFRKTATVWASAGQVISGVSEAEYSPDGLELAMTTTAGTVRIAARNLSGDWELGQTLGLPKPDPTFGENIVWLQTRLLITSDSVTNSYAKNAGQWGFVQAIPVNSRISPLRRADGFYHAPIDALKRFDLGPSGFRPAPSQTQIIRGVLVRGLDRFSAAQLAPPRSSSTCPLRPAFIVSASAYVQDFNLLFFPEPGVPTQLEFEERGAVAVIQTPTQAKIYFIAPDRIFGGNTAPPDQFGISQGGFESR
jgi:hypothetical protein